MLTPNPKPLWQYWCKLCGEERKGLLDHPHGIGGYSWACPRCGSHDIDSEEVKEVERVSS